MKKNLNLVCLLLKQHRKKLIVMRNTVLILLISALQVFASGSYAQTKTISLAVNDATIKDVLINIEKQSEFYFLYNSELIDVTKKVNLTIEEEKVDEILARLFSSNEVDYLIRDRYIVLTPVGGNKELFFAQQRVVSGKVTDSGGQTLPGVTVVIKGTTQGTVTNADGHYSLPNIPEDATLVFSFVGMRTQEIEVGNQAAINVTMVVDAIGIEEVVAVGYGTARKTDLTGSAVQVDIQQMEAFPNTSFLQALQGAVSGLNVGIVNSAGGDPAFSIRGQNTFSNSVADNAPLIVLDGIIYRGNIVDLNTSDIESVNVLKDASSSAIYGSQASNGVIIITTKKGLDMGKPIINYSGSYTVQIPSNKIRPMKRDEYIPFLNDVFWEHGSRIAPDYIQKNPDFSFASWLKTLEIAQGYEMGLDNDLWGSLTGNGFINNHNLSLNGKSQSLGYFISGGVTDVKGFMKNDNYLRYNFRTNMDAKINEWLNVGFQSFIVSSDYSGVVPSLGQTFKAQPFWPIYKEDGTLLLQPDGLSLNPYAAIEADDSNKRLNISGNLHADIRVPFLKGFNYRINASHNYRTRNQDRFDPYGANFTGEGSKNSFINYDMTFDNIISYQALIKKIHNINATLVYGVEKREDSYTRAYARNFENDALGYFSLQAGDPSLFRISSGAGKETSLYSMSRLIYTLKNKYILTGTIRRDGFSGFGSDKKIGIFPSMALGWIISEETFFQNSNDWLNYLKIRGSYGTVARRGVGRYDTMAKISMAPSMVFGDGGTTTIGQWISSMSNNELGWETTTGLNLGIDFHFNNSRIFGNIEYYNNNTKNIIYPIQLPSMTGFNSINMNIGKVHNNGVEFSLTAGIIKTRALKWNTTLNYSRNRNKLLSILGPDKDGKEDDLVANRLFIGETRNVIYDYEVIGMWQLSDIDSIPNGFYPGTYKIADLNDDGAYSASDDMKILGYSDPSYRFSIANNVDYKNFNLYFLINSIQGGKNYYYGNDSYEGNERVDLNGLSYQNVPQGAWDYWMPDNPDSKYRRLDKAASYSPGIYNQRNFIRLQDISLSYSFNRTKLNKHSIGNIKIFVSGKNLLTITDWKGLDPELGSAYIGLPVMANYSLGLNISF